MPTVISGADGVNQVQEGTITSADIADSNVNTIDLADSAVTTLKIADANVTYAKLEAYVQNLLCPSGMVAYFARSSVPSSWLVCDGSAVSRITFSALYQVIGTTYGAGNTINTFNLPDLRGEFIRGLDNGRGVDVGRVMGSAQAGSAIADQAYQTIAVFQDNVENQYFKGTFNSGPGAAGVNRNIYMGYVRPRNVALLPCIKT